MRINHLIDGKPLESRDYFETFAGPGYAFGVNTLLYAMTH